MAKRGRYMYLGLDTTENACWLAETPNPLKSLSKDYLVFKKMYIKHLLIFHVCNCVAANAFS